MDKDSGDKDDVGEGPQVKRKVRRERKEDEVADEKTQTKVAQEAAAGKARRKRGEESAKGDDGGGWMSMNQDPNKVIPEPFADPDETNITL